MTAMDLAHVAVGRAVSAVQAFEMVFAVLAESFRMISEPEYLELTQGAFSPSHWKNPTKNLIRRLSERSEIAPELEAEISTLLENRHLLIHRWGIENGLATPEASEYWGRYEALAKTVEGESKRITLLLLSYVLKWAEPEWASANKDEYHQRMKQLFLQARNEGLIK